jgi:hypothetical protein
VTGLACYSLSQSPVAQTTMTRSSAHWQAQDLQMIHRTASSHQKKTISLRYGCLLLACLTMPRQCDSLLSSFRQHRPTPFMEKEISRRQLYLELHPNIDYPGSLPSKVAQLREIGYVVTTRIQVVSPSICCGTILSNY